MWALGVWDAGGRRADSSKVMGVGKLQPALDLHWKPGLARARWRLETWRTPITSHVTGNGSEKPRAEVARCGSRRHEDKEKKGRKDTAKWLSIHPASTRGAGVTSVLIAAPRAPPWAKLVT